MGDLCPHGAWVIEAQLYPDPSCLVVLDLCPGGSTWRNCSGVCEQVSCEGLNTVTGPTHCRTDPCNACYYTVFKDDMQTEICRGACTVNSQKIEHAILKKARAVAAESDHPFFTYFHVLRRRYHCIKCKTARYSRSFVPVAIRM